MDVHHARQHFKLAEVEAGGGADRGQDGLHFAGGAMDVDTGLLHHFNHGDDLFFGCGFKHCDNHFSFPVSGVVCARGMARLGARMGGLGVPL